MDLVLEKTREIVNEQMKENEPNGLCWGALPTPTCAQKERDRGNTASVASEFPVSPPNNRRRNAAGYY